MADALALIQQLERERDAAVERCVDADDVSAGLYQEIKAVRPKWISVEERLPERGCQCLAINKYGDYALGRLVASLTGFCCEDYSNEPLFNVTHWMPLPAPPKEEE